MITSLRKSSGAGRQQGFTLLEILIAIVIFAVLATIVYGSFNAVISRTNVIKDESAVYDMAGNCLRRISKDLQAVCVDRYPLFKPPDFDDEPDPYRFEGDIEYVGSEQFPRLNFASSEHLPLSKGQPEKKAFPAGLARIRYYVEKDSGSVSGYVLKRHDSAFPYDDEPDRRIPDRKNDPVLCTGIKELKFTYQDGQGNDYETWDSDSETVEYATPRAVRIVLKISSDNGEHSFSTRVILPVYREPLKRAEK